MSFVVCENGWGFFFWWCNGRIGRCVYVKHFGVYQVRRRDTNGWMKLNLVLCINKRKWNFSLFHTFICLLKTLCAHSVSYPQKNLCSHVRWCFVDDKNERRVLFWHCWMQRPKEKKKKKRRENVRVENKIWWNGGTRVFALFLSSFCLIMYSNVVCLLSYKENETKSAYISLLLFSCLTIFKMFLFRF